MKRPPKRKYRLPGEPEHDEWGRRIRLLHPVSLKEELVRRQGNLCALCDGPMGKVPDDAQDRRPAMWMATYEHVENFADGGADDETNIVAAHRICNEKKSNVYAPQKSRGTNLDAV